MSRNLKPDYINKIRKIQAPNGYRFDIANYVKNPSHDYEYPSFVKTIGESDEKALIKRIFYFKHYDGSGEYRSEVYTIKKNGETWQIASDREEKVLEHSNRFNINRLLNFCE